MTERTDQLVDAVVLAAGINTIPLFEGCEPGYKAELTFGGQAALLYTLGSLLACDRIRNVCVVGPADRLRPLVESDSRISARCAFTPGGDTLLESIRAGLSAFPAAPRVLMTTADLPLLTSESVTDFLSACERETPEGLHNLFVSVVPKQAFTGEYETADKMFSRFRDVCVCQGNLALVDPWILHDPATAKRIDKAYAARKGRLSSALAFGWRVGLAYVFGVALWPLLTMRQLAWAVSKRFGFEIIPIVCRHPEIAVDIDEPADHAFVKARIARRSAEEAVTR